MAREVALLGVGMHPWGKWGRNFVEEVLESPIVSDPIGHRGDSPRLR